MALSEVIVKEKQIDTRFIRKDQVIIDERQHQYVREKLGKQIYSELTWVYTKYKSNIPRLHGKGEGLVNAYRLNDIFQINRFMKSANKRLKNGQYFIVCMETKDARKQRILNKLPKIFTVPYYYGIDFLLKRILPKLETTRNLYFKITHGRNRVLSLTEGLARLVCCGFEIVDFEHMGDLTCIISKKAKEPESKSSSPYGALIRLKRVGHQGKIIEVRKLRTMHPYSEYLQDFIFEKYDLQTGGKFKNDFRLTNWGRLFRRYWIDELPMFMNWFKGDMKLVGVRPLSQHYFELYPKDLQELRVKHKPGLIPPYYADLPEEFEEIVESERNYLEAYEKSPFLTDLRYFFKVFTNIIFRGARSR